MNATLKCCLGAIAATATIGFGAPALAQGSYGYGADEYEVWRDLEVMTLPQAFERAYFNGDRDFFRNRSIERQLEALLFDYTENEINRDAKLVYTVFQDALFQQLYGDPFLRTPDLPTPFTESLLTLPSYDPSEPVRVDPAFDERLF